MLVPAIDETETAVPITRRSCKLVDISTGKADVFITRTVELTRLVPGPAISPSV